MPYVGLIRGDNETMLIADPEAPKEIIHLPRIFQYREDALSFFQNLSESYIDCFSPRFLRIDYAELVMVLCENRGRVGTITGINPITQKTALAHYIPTSPFAQAAYGLAETFEEEE